jgi:hypothetical protein
VMTDQEPKNNDDAGNSESPGQQIPHLYTFLSHVWSEHVKDLSVIA